MSVGICNNPFFTNNIANVFIISLQRQLQVGLSKKADLFYAIPCAWNVRLESTFALTECLNDQPPHVSCQLAHIYL